LRGLAAVTVLIGHFVYVFWGYPDAVASLIGAPPVPRQPMSPDLDGYLGHVGVAIFFLISGFVIPFSLLNRSRLEFGIARFFRLWPTYTIGFGITVLAVILCSRSYGRPVPFLPSTVVYQVLFVRDFFWVPSIDGIVWTLEIEVKFYILIALIANG